MTTHSQKKLDDAALLEFRNRFNLPLTGRAAAAACPFFKPAEDSAGSALPAGAPRGSGGYLPQRRTQAARRWTVPALDASSACQGRRQAR